MVEEVCFSLHAPRTALHGNTFELAELCAAEFRQVVHVDVHIAGHEEVYVAIAIVVGPGGPSGETSALHLRFIGDVFKCAVAFVAIESIATVSGDVEIEIAIVVIIGDGNAHAPTFVSEPCFVGNVGEFEVGILVPERDERIAAVLAIAIDG